MNISRTRNKCGNTSDKYRRGRVHDHQGKQGIGAFVVHLLDPSWMDY